MKKHMENELLDLPEYGGINLCPYCQHLDPEIKDEEIRNDAHMMGIPGQELDAYCEYYTEYDPLDGIEGEEYESSPGCSAVAISWCKHYKRIYIDFQKYLQSELWADKKTEILKRDGYKCVLCGSAKNLHVHHITYENLPFEKDEDLITVCNKCHEKLHKMDIARKHR